MSDYVVGQTEVADTFAEAFGMRYARVVITAATDAWAHEAARSMTGFATSVIGCKCEAAIERRLGAGDTPDGRPGIAVLLFAMDREGVGKRILERVGQSVMTCPTTACFDGLPGAERTAALGSSLRYFGDGFQASKVIGGQRFWRIPVMAIALGEDDRVCQIGAVPMRSFTCLRTGCQWQALDQTELCAHSTAHGRFQAWVEAGVFFNLWKAGVERFDDLCGIDWDWLAMDGAMTKAPLGGKKT